MYRRLVIRLHWLLHLVQRCRDSVRAVHKTGEHPSVPEPELLRRAQVLTHTLACLSSALLEHVQAQIDGACCVALTDLLAAGAFPDVASLRDAHEAYVSEVAARCFVPLGKGGDEVGEQMEAMVLVIADGCTAMEVGLATDSLEDRLTGIRLGLLGSLGGLDQALKRRRGLDAMDWSGRTVARELGASKRSSGYLGFLTARVAAILTALQGP